MIMEHTTIKELANGYYKIKPDSGYQLVNKKSGRTYSEAVTKDINEFEVVEL